MFFLKSVMNSCDNDPSTKQTNCKSESDQLTLIRRTSCILLGVNQHQSSSYTKIIKSSAIFVLKTIMNICANVFKRKRSRRDSDFSSDTTEEQESSNKRRRLCDTDPLPSTKEEISQSGQQQIQLNTISLKRNRTQSLDDEANPSKRRELDETHGVNNEKSNVSFENKKYSPLSTDNEKAANDLRELYKDLRLMRRNYEKTFDMRLLCWHGAIRQEFSCQASKLKRALQNHDLHPQLYVFTHFEIRSLEFQDKTKIKKIRK